MIDRHNLFWLELHVTRRDRWIPHGTEETQTKKTSVSYAPLDAFCVGCIAALQRAGYKPQEIVDSGAVRKPDGSNVLVDNVNKTLGRLQLEPTWRGERQSGSGRTRSTTPEQDQEMVNYVQK